MESDQSKNETNRKKVNNGWPMGKTRPFWERLFPDAYLDVAPYQSDRSKNRLGRLAKEISYLGGNAVEHFLMHPGPHLISDKTESGSDKQDIAQSFDGKAPVSESTVDTLEANWKMDAVTPPHELPKDERN